MLKILSWEYSACGKIVRMPLSLGLPRTKILLFQGTFKRTLKDHEDPSGHNDQHLAWRPYKIEGISN